MPKGTYGGQNQPNFGNCGKICCLNKKKHAHTHTWDTEWEKTITTCDVLEILRPAATPLWNNGQ